MMAEPEHNIRVSPSGLMTIQDAAVYLGAKLDTLRWLRRTKRLPFVKIGAKLMIKQSILDAYIDQMTEPARPG